jgi:hypothetical protein
MSDPAQAGGGSAPPKRKSRFDWGPNATLIAGIATLLLAMGVGVLIGHYSASGSSSKRATPIVVTGVGSTGTTGTTAEAGAGPTGAASTGSKSSGGSGAAAHAAAKPSAASSKPANPTVQVGQKGHGQGYQHGEFTGHFFGSENEEDAGEEGEEEHSSGKKKH